MFDLCPSLVSRTDARARSAGSEATPILGQTENGVKTTLKSSQVLPTSIIYDVNLTLTLPVSMSVTSGINAIAHAVSEFWGSSRDVLIEPHQIEALYAPEANPVIDLLACDGIAKLAKGMATVYADPSNLEGRAHMLYGAWACGTCLGSVGMGLHHKLCHTVRYDPAALHRMRTNVVITCSSAEALAFLTPRHILSFFRTR